MMGMARTRAGVKMRTYIAMMLVLSVVSVAGQEVEAEVEASAEVRVDIWVVTKGMKVW